MSHVSRMDRKETSLLLQDGINNSYHSTIGNSPAEIVKRKSYLDVMGRELNIDIEIMNERAISKSQEEQGKSNIKRKCDVEFKVGQNVFVDEMIRKKTTPIRKGPFRIIEKKNNDQCYLVDMGNKLQWINLKRLRPFNGEGNLSQ